VREVSANEVAVALDETTLIEDVNALIHVCRIVCLFFLVVFILFVFFQAITGKSAKLPSEPAPLAKDGPFAHLRRTSAFLTHPTFNKHHSETEMLRYLYSLQMKDLSLASAMIPLGSCTMKLNATSEMIPVSWPQFSTMHPFAPKKQAAGYAQMAKELELSLASITGFHAVSLQPNSGAQGEYAGLRAIRAFQAAAGQVTQKQRKRKGVLFHREIKGVSRRVSHSHFRARHESGFCGNDGAASRAGKVSGERIH
jgi:glycine dehydrogenase